MALKEAQPMCHMPANLPLSRNCRGDAMVRAPRQLSGFTLIEVMITVAIVAILSAVAIPSYSDYVRRGQLPEAFTYLSDYKVKMEQYYQDNRNYGVTDCVDTNTPTSWNFTPAAAKYFTFTCALNGATAAGGKQGFTLTATGKTGGRTAGHVYTMDSGNASGSTKHTTQFRGATSTKNCWLVKGDEC